MRHRLLAATALAAAALGGCDLPTPKAPAPRPEAPAALTPPAPMDPKGAPVQYTVSFPRPQSHYAEIEAQIDTGGAPSVTLMMGVWTPGSYLVREFSRHVEDLQALDPAGRPQPVAQIAKNRWTVQTGGAKQITVSYRVYGREMSVRTNWVEAGFAMLNGAPTFITPVEALAGPYDVRLRLPKAWFQSHTGLEAHPDGEAHHYRAADFDTLVDSPIVIGNPSVHRFQVGGVPHTLVDAGLIGPNDRAIWDGDKAAADVAKIVKAQADFWGQIPYSRYVFLNVLSESGGGLEHKNSTLMMTSLWATERRKDYVGWLGLVSHEFFHTWNVKRLRPKALGPFDYEAENYTRSLWVAEGITSYYDELMLRRAEITTEAEYLRQLSKVIERTEGRPGRNVQSLADASFNAWIKHYRPDENSENTSVSYYTRGSVAAFLLDARIQQASGGAASLDDVMRAAYAEFSGEAGYTPAQFRALVSRIAGADLSDFFRDHIDGTQPFHYAPALAWYGLRFKASKRPSSEDPPQGWLGLNTRSQDGALVVTKVERGSPAWQMGLNVDDELLAFDGYRIQPGTKGRILSRYRPGDSASIMVARRGRILTLDGLFVEAPSRNWTIERDPNAAPSAQLRRLRWLSGGQPAGQPGGAPGGQP